MAKAKLGYGTGNPSPVDIHVGTRVRLRRTLFGMTQTDIGDALGLTFQQVQKYERGTNRISSSRLYELSRLFDVPVEHFFEDMPPKVAASSPAKRRGRAKEPVSHDPDLMAKLETMKLVRAYYRIEDADVRQRVYELTKAVAADAGNGS